MKYKRVDNASRILEKSLYFISNPTYYKNKWSLLFGNNNPIYLELGMGRGDFIIKMAKTYPKINFVGVEINESQLSTAISRLGIQKIPNLKLVLLDARQIDTIFGREIDTIYLTFSEPWPKPEDERKRFTHISYLKIYDKIFKKNKHIIMKTDNKGLFAYSLETLSQYWYVFNKVSLDLHHEENPISNIMTDFEKDYYKEGRPIYYVDAKFDN